MKGLTRVMPKSLLACIVLVMASGCASWPPPSSRDDPYPYPVPPPNGQGQQTQRPQPQPQQPDTRPETQTYPEYGQPEPEIVEVGPPQPKPVNRPRPQRPKRSPATIALAQQARRQLDAGELEASASSLERALRIEPRDAGLWQDLARVRIAQGRAKQAEALLKKSNALAVNDADQQAQNWRLIAQSRRMVGDAAGATRALDKARSLELGV